jgi:hypothetical protein
MIIYNTIQEVQARTLARMRNLIPYTGKTQEDAEAMFQQEAQVNLVRRRGWVNEEERWKIAFYAQMLPRRSGRSDCAVHLYEIAARFSVSLPTVYKYANYNGEI